MSASSAAPAKRKAPKDAPPRPRGKKTPNYFGTPTVSSFAAANVSSIAADSTPAPSLPAEAQPLDGAPEEPTPVINIVPIAQLPYAPLEATASVVSKEKQTEFEKIQSIYASFKSELASSKLPPSAGASAPSPATPKES